MPGSDAGDRRENGDDRTAVDFLLFFSDDTANAQPHRTDDAGGRGTTGQDARTAQPAEERAQEPAPGAVPDPAAGERPPLLRRLLARLRGRFGRV